MQNYAWAKATWSLCYTSVILAVPLSTAAQLPPPPAGAIPLAPATAPCAAPIPGEYALLILHQSPADPDRVRQALPLRTPWQFCNYQSLGRNIGVMQVPGLTSFDTAQALGQRVIAATGLAVVVVQTAAIAPPATPTNAANVAANPQPLGPGYAVLVDFANRPELALESTRQLQAILGRAIALVAHHQRPYLLGLYTPDAATATTLAQDLTLRGFGTQVVDSSQVLVLRSAVAIE